MRHHLQWDAQNESIFARSTWKKNEEKDAKKWPRVAWIVHFVCNRLYVRPEDEKISKYSRKVTHAKRNETETTRKRENEGELNADTILRTLNHFELLYLLSFIINLWRSKLTFAYSLHFASSCLTLWCFVTITYFMVMSQQMWCLFPLETNLFICSLTCARVHT